jgi:hypothetical protein
MKVAQRIFFYGIGFVIGIVLLLFFLGGKKTSCDYGPEARVLKNIRNKPHKYSKSSIDILQTANIDTADVRKMLNSGSVNFSESNTRLDSCKLYVIEGTLSQQIAKIQVQNCESKAVITEVVLE